MTYSKSSEWFEIDVVISERIFSRPSKLELLENKSLMIFTSLKFNTDLLFNAICKLQTRDKLEMRFSFSVKQISLISSDIEEMGIECFPFFN